MDYNLIPDNVSKFDNVYDVLKERGFIEQSTDEDKVRELLQNEKVKFYIGFDPTADCLHVGHFMQVIIMMYMQKFGHTPVVLIGGGTGMVGDPSGRTDMRQVMDIETIEHNCEQFKKLFDQFLEFDEGWKYEGNEGVYTPGHENKTPEPGKAIAVNNARWLRPLNYIDFLREIGSLFNINTMLRLANMSPLYPRDQIDALMIFLLMNAVRENPELEFNNAQRYLYNGSDSRLKPQYRRAVEEYYSREWGEFNDEIDDVFNYIRRQIEETDAQNLPKALSGFFA